MDDIDVGQQPRCETCGVLMRLVAGGDECPSCGSRYEWDTELESTARRPAGARITALDIFRSERASLDPR